MVHIEEDHRLSLEPSSRVEAPSTASAGSAFTSDPSNPSLPEKPSVLYCQTQLSIADTTQDERESAPWRPSILRVGALSGLGALALSFLSIIASCAVLVASNGDPVTSWKYQPNVYLAVLTAVSNKALAFATVQGTVVTFWLRALHGASLAQLHRDWSFGLHVYRAVLAGRHFSLLALACISATLVVMDGPLLQRASSVGSEVPSETVPLTTSMTPEIPAYFTGYSVYYSPNTTGMDFQNDFLPVAKSFTSNHPMKGGISGCSGTCIATIRAPALAVDHCSTTFVYRNFTEPLSGIEEKLSTHGTMLAPPANRVAFAVTYESVAGKTEQISLKTAITNNQVSKTCAGLVNITACFLVSAIAEYEVKITDDVISFVEPPSSPKLVAMANNTAVTNATIAKYGLSDGGGWLKTTLSGIELAVGLDYACAFGLVPSVSSGDTPMMLPIVNRIAFDYITNYKAWDAEEDCAPAWKDPRDDVMAAINELMFRTGLYTAQKHSVSWLKARIDDGLEIHTNVTGTPQSAVSVFKTDINYFVAAAVVQLFTICTILCTFWGYWRLGRKVSFSPLEIAKAFDAPLLRNSHSNWTGTKIARIDGARRVQYGVEKDHSLQWEHEALIIGEVERVNRPSGKHLTVREYYDIIRTMLHRPARRRTSQPGSEASLRS